MSAGQHCPPASAWTIRSVAVRSRDGPERLDQVYRRLIDGIPHDDQLQATSDAPLAATDVGHVQESRR